MRTTCARRAARAVARVTIFVVASLANMTLAFGLPVGRTRSRHALTLQPGRKHRRHQAASGAPTRRAARPDRRPRKATVPRIPVVASWYDDAGATACGFHALYGIANRTLPCGTHVSLAYRGRVVTATVDDRGPYVAGREFDLDEATATALGMTGVATILSSV